MSQKGMILYDNWCEMINKYYDSGDKEAAYMLLFAIMRLYSRDELIELPRIDLQMMLEHCISSGIETQIKHYEDGVKSGRPSKINNEDNAMIASLRASGQKQTEIAKAFGVSEKTISRADGWWNWKNYSEIGQNQTKLEVTSQNQEKEKEEYKEKEQEKEEDKNYRQKLMAAKTYEEMK